MDTNNQYEYDQKAQTERDFESLTKKQRKVVKEIVNSDVDVSKKEIADKANCDESYVYYVQDNFPHIINKRRSVQQVAADGGDPMMTIKLPASDVWKAMQMVSDDISQEIWRQTRGQ